MERTQLFRKVAERICGVSADISPEECFRTKQASSAVCQNASHCKMDEKSGEQLRYIVHPLEQSSFLRACPGSGKTEVTGIKAAYEIQGWRTPHAGIAVLTFTNNAAKVIEDRIIHYAGVKGIQFPHYVGTLDSWLHGYIFQPFSHLTTGYRSDDGKRTIRIIDRSCSASFLDAFKTQNKIGYRPIPANHFYFNIKTNNFVFDTPNEPETLSCNNLQLDETQEDDLRKTKWKFLQNGFATYQDAELLCYLLLRDKQELAPLLSKRFPVIFVDECQDLSYAQIQILEFLREKGILLHFIGDLNQAIYGFREVNPKEVEQYISEQGFTTLNLTNNYRSCQPIVDVCSGLMNGNAELIGKAEGRISPACVCFQYEKKELDKIPEYFCEYLKANELDIQRSAIIARSKPILTRLNPAFTNTLKGIQHVPFSLHLWNKPDKSLNDTKTALSSIGRFLSGTFWKEHNSDPKNQYCPEGLHKIEWRLFLSDFLTLTSDERHELTNYEVDWSTWTKTFNNVLDEHIHEFPLLLNKEFSKPQAPRGYAKKDVQQILQNPTPIPNIRFTTIHGIKGETVDAALLVSAPDKKSDGGYWEQWFEAQNVGAEPLRFSYVASSRPKYLLAWAIPKGGDVKRLIDLGFTLKSFHLFDEQKDRD